MFSHILQKMTDKNNFDEFEMASYFSIQLTLVHQKITPNHNMH